MGGEGFRGRGSDGVTWDRLEALRAAGAAALLVHEPAAAAESLRPSGSTRGARASTTPASSPWPPTWSRLCFS